MKLTRLLPARAFIAVLATLALGATGPVAASASTHHRRHHHSAIPQHNGGDHDRDNNGGPSDGDGNV
jgi:hypothetical protein